MKKLLYSVLALTITGIMFTGCGNDDGDDVKPGPKGPTLSFQTNTVGTGYTYSNSSLAVNTDIKIGIIIASEVNLKSTKVTVKYNNQAEITLPGSDSTFTVNTKASSKDYFYTIPADKGTYTITAYATDKDATTSSIKIVITALGPLLERVVSDTVWSLKASTAGHFSAYDLFQAEAITAAGSANVSQRDIVDNSTNDALARSWKTGNGTTFVISGVSGKLNGKVYSQFQFEQDIIDAYNAAGNASSNITGVDEGMLIIAKSSNGGSTRYYLIGIDEVVDATGSDNDYTVFHYKE